MAATLSDLVAALAYAGVGTAIGSVAAALVSSRSGRSEARAHATDMITEAAGHLSERQAATIDRLEKQSERQRKAILTLTTVLDELLDQIPIPISERRKLQAAMNAAKLAI